MVDFCFSKCLVKYEQFPVYIFCFFNRDGVQLESILKTRSLGGLRKNNSESWCVVFCVRHRTVESANKITTQVGEKYGCTIVDA